LLELSEIVKNVVGTDLEVVVEPTDDLRSYHVSSRKIREELGFELKYTIEDAVRGLAEALNDGKLPDSMTDPRYFNISLMQDIALK